MKNLFLTLFTALFAFGAIAQVDAVAPKKLEDPEYLLPRLDNPTLKGYLGSMLKSASVKVGVYDQSSSSYSSGATGTYDLLDAITGQKVVVEAGSVIKHVFAYVQTAGTSGGAATLEVGYSGSTAAIVPQTAVGSLTLNALLNGVPQGVAANMIARTADTDVTVTVGTAALTAGKVYVVMEIVPDLL